MADIVPKIGDWVVLNVRYSILNHRLCRVETVSNAMFTFRDDGVSRRTMLSNIIYAGSETVARSLAERLDNSNAMCEQECRKSRLLRTERDAKFIESAKADKR